VASCWGRLTFVTFVEHSLGADEVVEVEVAAEKLKGLNGESSTVACQGEFVVMVVEKEGIETREA